MTLRSPHERLLQTIAYEVGGILVATPIYAAVFGQDLGGSAALLAALSVAVMLWTPVHNTLFDWIEWRSTGRLASDRPHRVRLLHALSHEATSLVVTLPLLMGLGGLGLAEALLADLGLTAVYAAYAYLFYWVYDRLRPMRRSTGNRQDTKPCDT